MASMNLPAHSHHAVISKSEITNESTNNHQWPTEILPSTLHSQNLKCHNQTPTSAQHLLSQGQLNAEDFLETSPDIERTLMEAFLEDDFEGRLHLTTLSLTKQTNNANNNSNENDEIIVGMAFWREIPSEEMNEWMDFDRISKAIADRKLVSPPNMRSKSNTHTHSSSSAAATALEDDHHEDLSHDARNAMKLVKSDSISWIQNALQPCHSNYNNDNNMPSSSSTQSTNTNMIQKLTHSWIKIELIAIHRAQRGHHLGHILLGCTLAKAHALHHNEHAILHIAGGGATKNVPAARLYTRYGFVNVPRHTEGGPFTKPDRDLFVLGNIGLVLESLPWEEVMRMKYAEEEESSNSDDKEEGDDINYTGKRKR